MKIYYVFVSAILGYVAGKLTPFPEKHQIVLSEVITVLVFLTVFPAMLGFRFEKVKSIKKELLFSSLLLNFFWSPIFAHALITLMPSKVALGVSSAILFPCPSMNAAYVLIAGGNLEVSVAVMGINFALASLLYPILLTSVAGTLSYEIPFERIVSGILAVIVLPVILGNVLGKYYPLSLERRRVLTETSLNLLVFTIFFTKSHEVGLELLSAIPVSLTFILVTILLSELLSKVLGLRKDEHLSYVFVTAGKNNSTVIAILTLAGRYELSVYVLMHQFVQIVLLFLYSKLSAKNYLPFVRFE